MGIYKYLKFAHSTNLLKDHQLRGTILVIDGSNLEKSLYACYTDLRLGAICSDQLFGGDLNRLARYYRSFFQALAECQVTPIVLLDGTVRFDSANFGKRLERFQSLLDHAIEGANLQSTENVAPACSSEVFKLVLQSEGIRFYQTTSEADELLLKLGRAFHAPILTNDSDFLIEPRQEWGVITVISLLQNGFQVCHNPESDFNYLECQQFRMETLLEMFPGLEPEAMFLAGPLLGNDSCDFKISTYVVEKIGRQFPQTQMPQKMLSAIHKNLERRFKQFHIVFKWLAMQKSAHEVISYLEKNCTWAQQQLLDAVIAQAENQNQNAISTRSKGHEIITQENINGFFEANWDSLFPQMAHVPGKMHRRFVRGQVHKQLLNILLQGMCATLFHHHFLLYANAISS